jgi:hypothetical protein
MIPCEHKTIAVDRAVLKITFWPKFRKARLRDVFKAVSSYPEREHCFEIERERKKEEEADMSTGRDCLKGLLKFSKAVRHDR